MIRFGAVAVPVKLYSAVIDRGISFRLLHRDDQIPVSQKMINPRTREIVLYNDIRRGYETEDGAMVLLEKDELQLMEPEPSRNIVITHFVNPDLINHQWYDRPYYLGPDERDEPYFALAGSLEDENMKGLARWCMRKKIYIGSLMAENGYLKLITLRHSNEVLNASELPRPEGRVLEDQEIRMAEQLVRALEGDFRPADYRDEYRDRVRAFVEAKVKGQKIALKRPGKKKSKVVSLSKLLKQSIQQVTEERKIA